MWVAHRLLCTLQGAQPGGEPGGRIEASQVLQAAINKWGAEAVVEAARKWGRELGCAHCYAVWVVGGC